MKIAIQDIWWRYDEDSNIGYFVEADVEHLK